MLAKFHFKEAIKVGVYSTLIYNTILYIPAVAAIREWTAVYVLFLMMVVVPTLTCYYNSLIFTYFFVCVCVCVCVFFCQSSKGPLFFFHFFCAISQFNLKKKNMRKTKKN